MRALPFSVWKARRTVISAAASSCLICNCSRASRAACNTSCASSRNTSRISGSSSSPLDTRAGAAVGAVGATAAASATSAAGAIGATSSGTGTGAGTCSGEAGLLGRVAGDIVAPAAVRLGTGSVADANVGSAGDPVSGDNIGRPWLP